jgi:hypothetical protein
LLGSQILDRAKIWSRVRPPALRYLLPPPASSASRRRLREDDEGARRRSQASYRRVLLLHAHQNPTERGGVGCGGGCDNSINGRLADVSWSNGADMHPTVTNACSRIHPVTESTLLKSLDISTLLHKDYRGLIWKPTIEKRHKAAIHQVVN